MESCGWPTPERSVAVNWLGCSPSRPWRRDFRRSYETAPGITQVVFDPKIDVDAHKVANQIRGEFVLVVRVEQLENA